MVKSSGSQNRKRKVEIGVVNQKLSQSMAKFLTVSPRQNISGNNYNNSNNIRSSIRRTELFSLKTNKNLFKVNNEPGASVGIGDIVD